MHHARFQNHRPSGSGEEARRVIKVFAIYSHGGDVTWTTYMFFRSPFLKMLHMKLGFDWPGCFREDL